MSKWCSLLRRSLNHMDYTEKEVLLVVYLGSWGLSNYWRLYNVLHIAAIYTHHLKVNNKHVDIVIIIKLENSSTHSWISIELQKQDSQDFFIFSRSCLGKVKLRDDSMFSCLFLVCFSKFSLAFYSWFHELTFSQVSLN